MSVCECTESGRLCERLCEEGGWRKMRRNSRRKKTERYNRQGRQSENMPAASVLRACGRRDNSRKEEKESKREERTAEELVQLKGAVSRARAENSWENSRNMAGRSPKIDLPLISVTLTLSVMAWKDSSSFAKKDFKVCGDASHGVSVKKNRIESDDKTCGVVVLKKPMKAGAAYKLTFKDHCEAGGDKNGREPLLTLGFGVTDTLEIEGEQVHGEAIDSGL